MKRHENSFGKLPKCSETPLYATRGTTIKNIMYMYAYISFGAHFTKDFLFATQIRWKFRLNVIRSDRNKYLYMPRQRNRGVPWKKNEVMILLVSRREQKEFALEFELQWKNL